MMACDFFEGVASNGVCKLTGPPIPYKSPECVDLCGIVGVGGLSVSHIVRNPRKKGASRAFLRCRCKKDVRERRNSNSNVLFVNNNNNQICQEHARDNDSHLPVPNLLDL
jgi:hypothetical protein